LLLATAVCFAWCWGEKVFGDEWLMAGIRAHPYEEVAYEVYKLEDV